MVKLSSHSLFGVAIILALLSSAGCQRARLQTPSTSPPAQSAAAGVTSPEAEAPVPTEPSAELVEEVSALQGLTIAEFFAQSYRLILLRDPEGITTEGLSELLGVRDDHLTDISPAAYQKNLALYRSVYDLLLQYDRSSLSYDEQISYDVYAWYLDDLLRMGAYPYADYPVNPLVVTGVQNLLEYLFVEYHAIRNVEDARDYITRLSLVDEKMAQLSEALRLRQEQGYLPPAILIQASLGDINRIAASQPESTSFYTALRDKLDRAAGISAAEKKALLEEAASQIQVSVLPAYQSLESALRSLPVSHDAAGGVWRLPDGDSYYQAALRHHTSTDLTPQQVHQLGLDALKETQKEMRQRFASLGYPADAPLPQLYQRLAQDGGRVQGSQILSEYQALIQQASQKLEGVLPELPPSELEVQGYPGSTAFYTAPALDGSRPGIFYAPLQGSEPRFKMPTLAYHEGVPGHHYQLSLARQLDVPLFRNVLAFNAYAEGWALYAERLAWEQGWYADDPYANLGRLQMEAFRFARLVVDTGLHADQWNFDQAVDFMVENTGLERGFIKSEVVRYLAWPGQAASYALGYLRLLELRQKAMDALGDRFNLKEFHRVVLETGSLPLPLLEQVVNQYITLASLEKVSDFPLYVMEYQGDYAFTEFLTSAHHQQSYALPSTIPIMQGATWACTGFAAFQPGGDILFGRNFDWRRHPALLLFTHPSVGYASVSMVDVSYLGFNQPQADWRDRRALLATPYWPFDGMNSAGLAVGMMAVPRAEDSSDPAKPTLNELQVMRLLLDRSANVAEAVQWLESVNIDFGEGPPLHYMLVDASGASAVVEFIAGEMVVLPNSSPWQVSTNFLISQEQPQGADSSCWRYNKAYVALQQSGGALSSAEAMELLEAVSQAGDYPTLWSVVYNLTQGSLTLAMDRNYQQILNFALR